ncbi:TPA: M67 family peptidase [Candidatus Poribacteria bacterium]|nr:M67 family peptidase [Candidatus Poribacteria bacterium]
MLKLSAKAFYEICEHAKRAYPEECCGIILLKDGMDIVRPCTNIQNKLHAQEPNLYSQTARVAYVMAPQEMFYIFKEAEENDMRIKAFYHSHPDHGAFFSEEDKNQAVPWDEPLHPNCVYIVISIYNNREVKDVRAYTWNHRKFVEIPIDKFSMNR